MHLRGLSHHPPPRGACTERVYMSNGGRRILNTENFWRVPAVWVRLRHSNYSEGAKSVLALVAKFLSHKPTN